MPFTIIDRSGSTQWMLHLFLELQQKSHNEVISEVLPLQRPPLSGVQCTVPCMENSCGTAAAKPPRFRAVGLQCYHYSGVPDHAAAEQTVMTCESTQPYCSSTFMTFSGLLHVGVLTKGCSSGETCNQTLTGSLKHIDTSETSRCCDKDLCNQDLVPDLGEDSWTECLACQGQPLACGGSDLPSLRCGPSQKSCIELSITTTLSQDTRHTMIKSCSNTSTCPELAAFSNGQNQISYASSHHCCKGSQCNRGHFKDVIFIFPTPVTCHRCCRMFPVYDKSCGVFPVYGRSCGVFPVYGRSCGVFPVYGRSCEVFSVYGRSYADPGSENGIECYSHSSPGESGTMKCLGPMTQCMDLTGSSPDDVVMSGCATEAFCQGLYPKFSIPGWKSTLCCGHSLCNHNHKKGTKGGSDK
ncbi:unnamed protein product [Ranitomeya imitator]|uniref:UPAR/Ly6 domain-containing protein n=1 Tax=Ranitomeya imitator TaxID=111125 RepID=A0ABN9L2M5_9NEOB|nr:unnamed protein product [Ranitomeya imitator]